MLSDESSENVINDVINDVINESKIKICRYSSKWINKTL